MDLLKWIKQSCLVFAIMLCGSNSACARRLKVRYPCADGLSRQRIHVTLRKPTKPRRGDRHDAADTKRNQIHTDELVDIREVSVDKNLPKEERIAAFIRQDQKSLPLPLRRFRGKRLLCRERCYVGGMSARHFALSDILAFSAESAMIGVEKDENLIAR